METALQGLYAGNPMAAMAAYGLLRSVPAIQMRWREDDIPVVDISADDVIDAAMSAVLSAPPLPPQKMMVDEYRSAMAMGDPELRRPNRHFASDQLLGSECRRCLFEARWPCTVQWLEVHLGPRTEAHHIFHQSFLY